MEYGEHDKQHRAASVPRYRRRDAGPLCEPDSVTIAALPISIVLATSRRGRRPATDDLAERRRAV
jgi:hypothetical protein